MHLNRAAAFGFLISGALLIVCCFLPLKTVDIVNAVFSETEVIKLMPTVLGFIVMVLGLLCVIFPIVGYKKQSAMLGTVAALISGFSLWRMSAGAEASATSAEQVNTMMTELFGSSSETVQTTVVTTSYGFYIMIIAIILVLITGFAYTITDET